MSRKLYVGTLPFETRDVELQEIFERTGTVETVTLMRDVSTGRGRGFAFVEMATDEDARKAIEVLHSVELGGPRLTVNEAQPRERERIDSRSRW